MIVRSIRYLVGLAQSLRHPVATNMLFGLYDCGLSAKALLQGDYGRLQKLLRTGVDVNLRSGEPLREAISNSQAAIWCSLLDWPATRPDLRDQEPRQ